MILPILSIAPSPKGGRGVFATERIEPNTIIEISPVLVFSPTERIKLEETNLYNYIFEWGSQSTEACIGLGYLSMYNHSFQPNAVYDMDMEFETMKICTIAQIEKGDEIFINYNSEENKDKPVWFEAI